jgi:hypothetical protein
LSTSKRSSSLFSTCPPTGASLQLPRREGAVGPEVNPMVETKTTQNSSDEFFVLDHRSLRSLSVALKKKADELKEFAESGLKEFLEMLGFYTKGSTVGSKVYERIGNSYIERIWIEVHNAEGLYTVVFAMSTRNTAKIKELATILNRILEDYARAQGFERVV